jgi:hypothetical protein
MQMWTVKGAASAALATVMLLGVTSTPALSHHSFAMYDQTVSKTMTGKLTRFVPGGNHVQLIFEVLDADGKTVMQDGKPLLWGVEGPSAAASARAGLTVANFPAGTILTVVLHPLRDGRPFGALAGTIVKCGNTMPSGGCTKQTGQELKTGNSA